MEAAIEQTKKCLTATEEANKIIISQSGLDAILAAVKDYYERIRELETDININVDGGTPNQPTSCLSREEHRSRPIMTSISQERHTQFEKEVKRMATATITLKRERPQSGRRARGFSMMENWVSKPRQAVTESSESVTVRPSS